MAMSSFRISPLLTRPSLKGSPRFPLKSQGGLGFGLPEESFYLSSRISLRSPISLLRAALAFGFWLCRSVARISVCILQVLIGSSSPCRTFFQEPGGQALTCPLAVTGSGFGIFRSEPRRE